MQVAILAAGFTPGEADQLRRAMAAWKRKGGLEKYYERIVGGMPERGYTLNSPKRSSRRSRASANTAFPNRMPPASRCWSTQFLAEVPRAGRVPVRAAEQPADGLLQPVAAGAGCAPARHRGAAGRRHRQRLGIDAGRGRSQRAAQPAVRLGLSLQRGMRRKWRRASRTRAPSGRFTNVADLARRAGLDRGDLQVLAAANALLRWPATAAKPVASGRRRARQGPAAPDHAGRRDRRVLAAPTEGDDIVGDYRSQGLTLGRHPLALLRPRLLKQRFMPAES